MQNQTTPNPNGSSSVWQTAFDTGLATISREGIDKFKSWLAGTDFYQAPASTRFHESYAGGLVEHSVKTYNMLCALNAQGQTRYEDETIAICGLLHDLCKVNFYKPGFRNVKNDQTGKWEKVPTFTVEDTFPYGHGEKSVFLLERFIRLKPSEAIAIRWHMGGFDNAVRGGDMSLNKAFDDYPLAAMLHVADMQATYLLKTPPESEQLAFTN